MWGVGGQNCRKSYTAWGYPVTTWGCLPMLLSCKPVLSGLLRTQAPWSGSLTLPRHMHWDCHAASRCLHKSDRQKPPTISEGIVPTTDPLESPNGLLTSRLLSPSPVCYCCSYLRGGFAAKKYRKGRKQNLPVLMYQHSLSTVPTAAP